MEGKTEEDYIKIFETVISETKCPLPSIVISDYEKAIENSVEKVFGIKTSGCFFHYAQALYKSALKQKFLKPGEKNTPNYFFIKKLIALALVPEAHIRDLFNDVVKEYDGDSDITKFCTYFTKTWLDGYTPSLFSVYQQDQRTNNKIEAYHRSLNRDINSKVYSNDIIEILKSQLATQRVDLMTLRNGGRISRPRRTQYLLKETNLKHAYEQFDNNKYTAKELHLICTNLSGPLMDEAEKSHSEGNDVLDSGTKSTENISSPNVTSEHDSEGAAILKDLMAYTVEGVSQKNVNEFDIESLPIYFDYEMDGENVNHELPHLP